MKFPKIFRDYLRRLYLITIGLALFAASAVAGSIMDPPKPIKFSQKEIEVLCRDTHGHSRIIVNGKEVCEQIEWKALEPNYLIFGVGTAVTLAFVGLVIFYFRRRSQAMANKPPVPSHGLRDFVPKSEANCLIRQSDCGLQAGQPECPKCGMRSDVRYVSKEDMDAAISTAQKTYRQNQI